MNTENKKVVVVEDSPPLRAIIVKLLTDAEFDVCATASDGEEALEQIEIEKPDFITLDIQMPKKNGVEVLDELMEKETRPAVIMVSSISDAKTVMSCLRKGACGYVPKPFKAHLFVSKIKTALEKKNGL